MNHNFQGPLPVAGFGRRVGELGSPDGWIDDVDRHRYGPIPNTRFLACLPKMELSRYDGDPMKWLMFVRSFFVQVDRVCVDDSERQEFLRSCLSEELQRLVYLLMHPDGYQQCLRELRDRYGNPSVVAAACAKGPLQLVAPLDHDFKALSTFASSLRSAVATLFLGGFQDELKSQATLQQVV